MAVEFRGLATAGSTSGHTPVAVCLDGEAWEDIEDLALSLSNLSNVPTVFWVAPDGSVWIAHTRGYYWRSVLGHCVDGVWSKTNVDCGQVTSIWGAAADDIWIGGLNNKDNAHVIYHWDGASLTPFVLPTGGGGGVTKIQGFASNDVYASYYDGSNVAWLLHWDGATWSVHPATTDAGLGTLEDWHVVSSTDIWKLSQISGTRRARHWDGAAWTSFALSSQAFNNSGRKIWVSGADVWVVGKAVLTGTYYQAVWRGGTGGFSLFKTWSDSADYSNGDVFCVVGASSSDVWTFGDYGFTSHWNGAAWTQHRAGHITQGNAVAAQIRPSGDLWVFASGYGFSRRLASDGKFRPIVKGETGYLRRFESLTACHAWDVDTDAIAVNTPASYWSNILRKDAGGWYFDDTFPATKGYPQSKQLYSLWAYDHNFILVGGGSDTSSQAIMWKWNGTAWTHPWDSSFNAKGTIYAIRGLSPTQVWALTSAGLSYFNGTTWTQVWTKPGTLAAWDFWVDPTGTHIFIATYAWSGETGYVYHSSNGNAGPFAAEAYSPLGAFSRIWGTAWNNVYACPIAVKEAAYVKRYNGSTWSSFERPWPLVEGEEYPWMFTVAAIAGKSANDILAISSDGAAYHWDGVQWRHDHFMPLMNGLSALQAGYLCTDGTDYLYVFHNNGLASIRRADGTWEDPVCGPYVQGDVQVAIDDVTQDVWLVDRSNGYGNAWKWSPITREWEYVRVPTRSHAYASNPMAAITIRDGVVIIGGSEEDVWFLENGTWRRTRSNLNTPPYSWVSGTMNTLAGRRPSHIHGGRSDAGGSVFWDGTNWMYGFGTSGSAVRLIADPTSAWIWCANYSSWAPGVFRYYPGGALPDSYWCGDVAWGGSYGPRFAVSGQRLFLVNLNVPTQAYRANSPVVPPQNSLAFTSAPNPFTGAYYQSCWANPAGRLFAQIGQPLAISSGMSFRFYYSDDLGDTWTEMDGDVEMAAGVPWMTGNYLLENVELPADPSCRFGVSQYGVPSMYGYCGLQAAPPLPPMVIDKKPAPDAELVPKGLPLSFNIINLGIATVILRTVEVFVRGVRVFANSTFLRDWSASEVYANGQGGFGFVVRPPPPARWRDGEIVQVRVKATNTAGLPVDDTWWFGATPRPFTSRIYPMIFDGVKKADEEKD